MNVCPRGRYYDQVILFPPSWIWAIGVSSHSQSHELGEKQNTFRKKKNDVFSVYDNWKMASLHKKVLKNLSNDYTCIPETALSCYSVLRTKCR